MLSRRSFLTGASALAVSPLLTSCGLLNGSALQVRMLRGSVPTQILRKFRQQLRSSSRVNFVPVTQLADSFALLQAWAKEPGQSSGLALPGRSSRPLDLLSIGDAWLASAIQENLIVPLDPKSWSNWSQIAEPWRSLVQRNQQGVRDPQGKIWAAPYRWGSTVIAYRRQAFQDLGWVPQDWQDLWRPELRGKISLLDQPREVIGLALKRLGQSYNHPDPEKVPNLAQSLRQLHQQVKLYERNNYLQPLSLGDTWLAVGWSADILPVVKRDRNLAVVFPQSGTALWADLWVRPAKAKDHEQVANDWINFCWSPEASPLFSVVGHATSPLLDRLRTDLWSRQIQSPEVLVPANDRLAKSEFLLPLSAASLRQYQNLWEQMRRS